MCGNGPEDPVLESFYKPHKRRKIIHDMFLDMLLW